MNYKHPQFRDMAGRLAQSFNSAEGERILRLITQLSTSPDGSSSEELKKSGEPPEKLRVGIWEAVEEPGGRSFVRANNGDPWHLWANVQKIPAKGLAPRVVLIGESVARGHLYDPHFTSALALQKMLDAACGPAEIEVVDLGRTDLVHEPLQELIPQALHLEPNALVIFAGNNWSPFIKPSEEQLLDMSYAFRATGSWRGVKESCESFLITNTRKTLRLLEEVARERGIPVVFVLPEFNLADWRTECISPPLLSSEQTGAWLRAKAEAEQLLQGSEWEKAEGLGERLLQLDQGTTTAGPYVLAEVSHRRGDHEAARTFLEMARDAMVCWPIREAPRCYSVIQQTMREEAAAHGLHLIDLPREFTKYLGGEIADRRLFLDYCHLSLEGIRISMALTAERLLPLLKYPPQSSKELGEVELKVSANVKAVAHFLAAVYNGNWSQRMELVRHHLRTALEYDCGIVDMMQLFLDLHIRRVPSSLCGSFEQLSEMPNMAAIIALYTDYIRDKFVNTKLVSEIGGALEEVGMPARAQIERLIIKEHSVKNRTVNLANKLYSTRSYSRFLADFRPEFYKATERNTSFLLVCDQPEPLKFSLTMKVPHVSVNQTISLRVNGSLVAEVAASDRWTTATCSAPAELVHPGLNQVEIGWPLPVWSHEKWREQVADCLEAGDLIEIIPMFGLIHSFRVSTERSTSPNKL
jgi:hypothetical protein